MVSATGSSATEIAVVTADRTAGEALVRACLRRGLDATVFEPRGQPPGTADVLVLDFTSRERGVVATAALVRTDPRPLVVGLGDPAQALPPGVQVDLWIGLDVHVEEFVDAIKPGRSLAAPTGPVARARSSKPDALTARELEVLGELLGGGGVAALGERLGISEHTVRTHLQNVMGKLGVSSRAAVAAWALREGLSPAVAKEPSS